MKAILNSAIVILFVVISGCTNNKCDSSNTPISELSITRGKHYGYYDISSKNLNYLVNKHNVQGEKIEITAEILPEHADSFGINIFKGKKITLLFDIPNKQLTINTKKEKYQAEFELIDEKIYIHLFVGNSMLEVFLNNTDSVAIECPCTTKPGKNSITMFDVNRKVTIEHFDIWEITTSPKSTKTGNILPFIPSKKTKNCKSPS